MSNFTHNAYFVAAGEACVRLRSSRKTCARGLAETPHCLISRLLRSRTQASPAATDRVMAYLSVQLQAHANKANPKVGL